MGPHGDVPKIGGRDSQMSPKDPTDVPRDGNGAEDPPYGDRRVCVGGWGGISKTPIPKNVPKPQTKTPNSPK